MIQKGNLAIYESKRKGVKYPKPERPRPQILKLLTFWVQNTKTPTNIKNTIPIENCQFHQYFTKIKPAAASLSHCVAHT